MAAAVAGTAAGVTAGVVLAVLTGVDALGVADVLKVEAEEEETLGVSAGQSEPASSGAVQGIISKKTGEHWAPKLASYRL